MIDPQRPDRFRWHPDHIEIITDKKPLKEEAETSSPPKSVPEPDHLSLVKHFSEHAAHLEKNHPKTVDAINRYKTDEFQHINHSLRKC